MSENSSKFLSSLQIDRSKARDTGLAMVLICLVLFLWLGNISFVKVATGLMVVTMTVPIVFKPFGYLWFGLAHIMGTIVSKILLLVVFLLIVTPMGLIRQIFGKDSLRLKKWKRNNESVFITRNKLYTAQDIEKPY